MTMNQRLRTTIVIAMLALLAPAANAGGLRLYLLPADNSVQSGDVVGLDVWYDFSAYQGLVLGGGFDILWDSNALQFEEFELNDVGDPEFTREPDVFDGLMESWAFASFSGLFGPEQIGTVWFTVLPQMGASTQVLTSSTSGIGGPFVCSLGCIGPLPIDFQSATLTRVPLPGGAWLLLSALAALGLGRQGQP